MLFVPTDRGQDARSSWSRTARLAVLGGIAVAIAWLPRGALAEPRLVDVDSRENALAASLDVLEDTSARMTFADVTSTRGASRFRRHGGRFGPNFGFTSSAVWVRFALRNPNGHAVERWLELDSPTADDIRVYVDDVDGRPLELVGGRNHPSRGDELPRRTPAFRIVVPAGEARTLFVRCAGENEVQLPLYLWSSNALIAHDATRNITLGVVYGVLAVMALYNLAMYLFVRERARLLYVGYVAAAVIWLAMLDGTVRMLSPDRDLVLPRWPNALFGFGAFTLWMLYARDALELRRDRPLLHRVVLAYSVVSVAVVLGTYFLFDWRHFNRFTLSFIGIVNVLFVLGIAILRFRDGVAGSGWFLAGQVAFLVLILVGGLASQGELPFQGPGLLIHAGYVADAVLLAIGMSAAAHRREVHVSLLNEAGRRFVPFEFLGILGKHELPEVRLGDQTQRELAVLFSDVRGFTTLAEGMSPAETIRFVNAWLAEAVPEIVRAGGFVDKYVGDAIMALFERPDDAVRGGLGLLAALDRLNARRMASGDSIVAIGVGIHIGPLVLGTVGSDDRLSCTVIGDSVNLASRVEGLTKHYGTPLLVTGAVVAQLHECKLALREIDAVTAKGLSAPVVLYEVLDALPARIRERREDTRGAFEEGRARFARADIEGALVLFEGCIAADATDVPAALHVSRCRDLIADGVPIGFDGVTRFDTK